MLQALELAGFKSFADRTRFEFPRGITVVVGPNGSGKSNVVDAVKWVLGAQSVKALRGKEMSDVIFSGAGNRTAVGAAEVSLTFDDSAAAGDQHAQRIQISRRLYRSGEAEYLINRQPCRLRDVREALAGAGMATGAYSIIEQGKVDALLQSSPRDRRLIFEEAAGISRFKTKRQEAARRLERVQQNLLRLTDLVDELQSRLTHLRSQAGRARKYQDSADRLRELRVQVSLSDWRDLSARISRLNEELAVHRPQVAALEQRVTEHDDQIAAEDQLADQLQQEARAVASAEAEIRERAAQCETKHNSQQARIDELQEETGRLARQLLTMTSRAGDSEQLVKETAEEFAAAVEKHGQLSAALQAGEETLADAEKVLADLKSRDQDSRSSLEQTHRQAAALENESKLLEAQLETAAAEQSRRQGSWEDLQLAHGQLSEEHAAASQALQGASSAAAEVGSQKKVQQEKIAADRAQLARLQKQHADLQGRLSGARERTAVLEELERRLEGLNAGAKEALRRAREQPDGPYGAVRGVVADLLHVDADSAQLVEIALGERANYLVVADARRIEDELVRQQETLPGRVTLLRLEVPPPASAVDRVDLSDQPGVIGRADQFVEAAADLHALVKRLLGRFWLVDTLATALTLSSAAGRGLNFVTASGEVVAADGALSIGPPQTAAGMLSRRSELRALHEQVAAIEQEILANQHHCERLEAEVPVAEATLHELSERHAVLTEEAGKEQLREAALVDRLRQAESQLQDLRTETDQAQLQHDATKTRLERCERQLTECGEDRRRLQQALQQNASEARSTKSRVEQLRQEVTEARVALAGSEQRREGLQRQMTQLQRDHEERDRALAETRRRAEECVESRAVLQRSNEQLDTEVAQLAQEKQHLAEKVAAIQQQQDEVRGRRSEAAQGADAVRRKYFRCQQSLQQLQLKNQQLEHQRSAICQKIRGDYQIELSEEADHRPATPLQNRPDMDDEIRALERQLEASGPVNLEAVEELDALEARFRRLSSQLADLETARQRLAQIVTQINTESRQLFQQTIDEVRQHFRELFSNLFGGGEADIIVDAEDGADLLECGIEIVARPPGKQPRNISLLSGGERTLTCVALLLAIFKNRPSPFCILDEVDAALDEANIDRFVEVLKEFMSATQFLVITHSKRTMSCSDTLYGVTMQESGVSKRVSVRFEDVTHDGHIKPAALARQTRAA